MTRLSKGSIPKNASPSVTGAHLQLIDAINDMVSSITPPTDDDDRGIFVDRYHDRDTGEELAGRIQEFANSINEAIARYQIARAYFKAEAKR